MQQNDQDFELLEWSDLDDSQLALVREFDDILDDHLLSEAQKTRQCRALIDRGMPLNVYTMGSERLLDKVCARKLDDLASHMIDESTIADYDTLRACIRNEACPKLALRLINEMRDDEHDIIALQKVIDEAFEKNGHTDFIQASPAVDAAMEAFSRHVLLPAAMLDAGYATNPKVKRWFEQLTEEQVKASVCELMQIAQDYIIGAAPTLSPDADLSMQGDFAQQLFRPTRLARTWNHPAIGFPQTLLTALPEREWHPLFREPYMTSNGYSLHCVTHTQELEKLGRALDNCLDKGEYAQDCCKASPLMGKHLICINNPSNRPVAIAEVDASIDGTRIVQAELSEARILKKGEAYDALCEWKRRVEDLQRIEMPIVNEHSELGETPESHERFMEIPAIYRAVGYEPSWEHTNLCFDDYKRKARRASTGRGKSNSCSEIIYDDKQDTPHLWTKKLEDGYVRMNHFIPEVTYDKGTAPVSMRNMDIQNWLVASGMLSQTRQLMDEEGLPEADYVIDPNGIAKADRAVPDAVYNRHA